MRGASVHDARLRGVLEAAGVELRVCDADLEIGPANRLRRAPHALVPISTGMRACTGNLAARGAACLACFARAYHAYARLKALGYRHVRIVRWQVAREMLVRPVRSASLRPAPRAIVVGGWSAAYDSVLDDALADARLRSGLELVPERMRPGASLTVVCGDGVLRVLLRSPEDPIARSEQVLLRMKRDAPASLKAIVPRMLAAGTSGPVRWSLEQRLPGERASTALAGPLLEQAGDVIVTISGLGSGGRLELGAWAESLARWAPDVGGLVTRLAQSLERLLEDAGSAGSHGDFWYENVLVRGERLVGIVDWEEWEDASPPLYDAIHLRLNDPAVPPTLWGEAFLRRALPWARSGGDAFTRGLCARLDLPADPALLERLAWAYWLRRASAVLAASSDRRRNAGLVDRLVRRVVAAWERSPAARSTTT